MKTKQKLSDLAIAGGTPAFAEKIHVGRPNIGRRERFLERVNTLLDRRWLTNNGPFVQEFEQKVAALLGVKQFIAVCNGTVALELAIRGLGMKGEVILPSFTFIATAHALQWQEISPVFCDIDPATHNLDPARVESLITPRTTGLIGVHVWGNPCAVEALEDIARRRGLKLMFDAAHAFACSHGGRMIGNFGQAEVFSFHATKFFNTLEGGGIATNDEDLAARLRLMKNFGFAGYDRVVYLGTNGKMTEVSAAMGLTSLESLDEVVQANRRNHEQYARELCGLPGVRLLRYDGTERRNYQYVVTEISDDAPLTRAELMDVIWAENVLVRRYFNPGCHRMEPYRTRYPEAGRRLPKTESLCERVLVLPTGTTIGPDDIAAIGSIMRAAFEHAAAVRKLLQDHAGKRASAS
jgi:dTDP-4-amino-4,6-dideoxygalactose transaminase